MNAAIRRTHVVRACAFCMLMAVVAVLCEKSAAAAEPSGIEKSFPCLSKYMDARGEKVDFLVLLDLSGSMLFGYDSNHRVPFGESRLASALDTLDGFVGGLPDGDAFRLVVFSNAAEDAYSTNSLSDADRIAVRAALNRIRDRGRLDPAGQAKLGDAYFRDTNHGRAIERAIEALNRDGHNKLQFVYLVTDGEHFVAQPTEAYGSSAPPGQSWKSLEARVRNELDDRSEGWNSVAFNLVGVSKQLDAPLVRALFAHTGSHVTWRPPFSATGAGAAAALADHFEAERKARERRILAQLYLSRLQWSRPTGVASASANVRSNPWYVHLVVPRELAGFEVVRELHNGPSAPDPTRRLVACGVPWLVDDGGVAAELSPCSRRLASDVVPVAGPGLWLAPRRDEPIDVSGKAVWKLRLACDQELMDLNVLCRAREIVLGPGGRCEQGSPVKSPEVDLLATYRGQDHHTVGLPVWVYGLAGGLVFLGMACFVVNRAANPWPRGKRLRVSVEGAGNVKPIEHEITHTKRGDSLEILMTSSAGANPTLSVVLVRPGKDNPPTMGLRLAEVTASRPCFVSRVRVIGEDGTSGVPFRGDLPRGGGLLSIELVG